MNSTSGHSHPNTRRTGWHRRVHAALMAHFCTGYERSMGDRKRALFRDLHGTVLEIGPGTGPNLAYYPPDIHWIGVEPNLHMHPYLHASAAKHGLAVELREGTAEQLPAATADIDVVVSTLVLCSVDDVTRTLAEIRRVLKPSGRFMFVEHVAAPEGTRLRRFQNWIQPLWTKLGDGCHPNRETWRAIEQAGFAHVQTEHFQPFRGPAGPHIAGVAVKG